MMKRFSWQQFIKLFFCLGLFLLLTVIFSGSAKAAMSIVNRIDLEQNTQINTGVISPNSDYAYFAYVLKSSSGSWPVPKITWELYITKIRLSDYNRVSTKLIDSVNASGYTIDAKSMVIDPKGEFIYLPVNKTLNGVERTIITKINTANLSVVGTRLLDYNDRANWGAAIDPAGEYAYFNTYWGSGYVPVQHLTKVRLSDLQVAGSLFPGASGLGAMVIDKNDQYLYSGYSNGIIKVNLNNFSVAATLGLTSYPMAADIDPNSQYAIFIGWDGRVSKIDLSTFQEVKNFYTGANVNFDIVAIDPTGEYFYLAFGQYTYPDPSTSSKVWKVKLSDFQIVETFNGFYNYGNGLAYEGVIGPTLIDSKCQYLYLGGGLVDGSRWTPFSGPYKNGRIIKLEVGAFCGNLPTVDLTADPSSIMSGQSSTLTWTSQNATYVAGSNFGAIEINGDSVVSPNETTDYWITVCNSQGCATDYATVTVGEMTPPTVDLKANGSDGPIDINYGDSAALSWTSQNAEKCSASGGWSGSKALNGTESTGSLTTTTTYTLTCSNAVGQASDSVRVNVLYRLFQGAFIGNSISLRNLSDLFLKIQYDPRVVTNPPPGFVDLIMPGWKEVSP